MFKFSKHLCPSFLGPAEVPERETEAESKDPTRISTNPALSLDTNQPVSPAPSSPVPPWATVVAVSRPPPPKPSLPASPRGAPKSLKISLN